MFSLSFFLLYLFASSSSSEKTISINFKERGRRISLQKAISTFHLYRVFHFLHSLDKMASSFHEWESDPLFSAAEVVQDSSDSLVQSEHPDPRFLSSIEYHKRDLATVLGTAKWQLEDFERAANSSIIGNKSQTREDVISGHRQFIMAIREHINEVEKGVKGPSVGDSMRNDHERDLLASFLTGGNPKEHLNHYEMEENKRNIGSHYTTRIGSDMMNSLPENSHERHGGGDHWDLEANEAKSRSFFHEIKSRATYSIMFFFGFLINLWSTHRNRIARNYTKRLKDGEKNRHSPTYTESSHSAQVQRLGLMLGSGYRSFQGICFRLQSEVYWCPELLEGSHLLLIVCEQLNVLTIKYCMVANTILCLADRNVQLVMIVEKVNLLVMS
ncbi:hypothetical protein Peur_015974 [Populus x canadensis]